MFPVNSLQSHYIAEFSNIIQMAPDGMGLAWRQAEVVFIPGRRRPGHHTAGSGEKPAG